MSAPRSYSFSWFVVGFLSGIAATLVVLIFAGARQRPEPIRISTPPIVERPRRIEPPAAPAQTPPAPPPTPDQIDQQVAEDAAAAGMTSRSRARAEQ